MRKSKLTYRSGLEEKVANQIARLGIEVVYESPESVIRYIRPQSNHRYTPDFVLPNGIIIETKGMLSVEDRKKHILIRDQHPDLDIRFVFSNSRSKLYKGSPNTYADWAVNNGFKYSDKFIPEEWIKE